MSFVFSSPNGRPGSRAVVVIILYHIIYIYPEEGRIRTSRGCDHGFLIFGARRPLVTRTRGILDERQGIPRPTDAERARRPRDHVTITHTDRRRRNASLPRAQCKTDVNSFFIFQRTAHTYTFTRLTGTPVYKYTTIYYVNACSKRSCR